MKPMRRSALMMLFTSLSIFFLVGCTSPKHASFPRDDFWWNLDDEVKALLLASKDSLAKGEDFKVIVGGSEVSGARMKKPFPPGDPPDQRLYWLNSRATPSYSDLNGFLSLHRTDSNHVDAVFRLGALQMRPSPIAICVDDYEVGPIKWDREVVKQE